MSDIILDNKRVRLEADHFDIEAHDLSLDHAGRRIDEDGARRALVHGKNDQLIINFGSDYPGGVRINGEVAFPGKIKTNHLRLESHDLHLDHPSRRSSSEGARRAMVHGKDDGLIINFNGDYPGGVRINGEVDIPGSIKTNHLRLESHDLHLDHPSRRSSSEGARRAMVHGKDDGLIINFNGDYPGGVTINGRVTMSQDLLVDGLDVVGELRKLKSKVDELEARIVALK